jgi:xanthine dehydrogenase YagR molybdenum-binding subunit
LQLPVCEARRTYPISSGSGDSGVATVFSEGQVRSGARSIPLSQAAGEQELVAEDFIEFGDLNKKQQQSTFGAHFVEVGVDSATGEELVRRMLAVCASGADAVRLRYTS